MLLKTKIVVPDLVTNVHLYLSGMWLGVAPRMDLNRHVRRMAVTGVTKFIKCVDAIT